MGSRPFHPPDGGAQFVKAASGLPGKAGGSQMQPGRWHRGTAGVMARPAIPRNIALTLGDVLRYCRDLR